MCIICSVDHIFYALMVGLHNECNKNSVYAVLMIELTFHARTDSMPPSHAVSHHGKYVTLEIFCHRQSQHRPAAASKVGDRVADNAVIQRIHHESLLLCLTGPEIDISTSPPSSGRADGDTPVALLILCVCAVVGPLTMHPTPPQHGAPALSTTWHTVTSPLGTPLHRPNQDPKSKRG